MATLSHDDVEKLFSGAPQYFSRSEGHFTGAPHPSVAFPFDEELEIRDLTDHTQIEDEAWRCVTAWPHIIRDHHRRRRPSEKPRAHFVPRCRERPNMLSMPGLEKGSMGYQAALELSVADSLQEENFGFSSLGSKPRAIVEARQRLLTSKANLRRLSEISILKQFIKVGSRARQDTLRTPGFVNILYNELFTKILHPPLRPIDRTDPCGLQVQIQALLAILAAPNVWIDFSYVEWRIRLGQLLWGLQDDDGVRDGEVNEQETEAEHQEERYWLLLQILLACELLIRLDALTEGEEQGLESIKPIRIINFEKGANTSVKWSMLLARAWLDNIVVTEIENTVNGTAHKRHPTATDGWLASLTERMSFAHHDRPKSDHVLYEIHGRHGERQVEGLIYFARRLRWPGIDEFEALISKNAHLNAVDAPLNPSSAPTLTPTQRSSYFSTPNEKKSPSRRRSISAVLHPSGWISKSYISGLMLPGESLCHLMMATLIENDTEAIRKLGPVANLCGGFVYNGKSFWSTQCIVGRVLGAGKGSIECMGWISSDLIPEDFADGWASIESVEVAGKSRASKRHFLFR